MMRMQPGQPGSDDNGGHGDGGLAGEPQGSHHGIRHLAGDGYGCTPLDTALRQEQGPGQAFLK